MATHNVSMKIAHAMDVGNVDVEFEIRKGTRLMGRVKLSKGSIDWTPANARKSRKATWTEFAA